MTTVIGVVEGVPTIEFEDGVCAMIAEVENLDADDDDPDDFYVRIMSWNRPKADGTMNHPLVAKLNGKRVRVTIEVID